MTSSLLDAEACRLRQKRLAERLPELGVDLAVLTRSESILWLTGAYVGPLFEPMAAIDRDGQVALVLPSRRLDIPHVADVVVPYEEKWLSTMRNDQRQASTRELLTTIERPPRRAGAEFSRLSGYLTDAWTCTWRDVEPTLLELRRFKYDDELALMRRANEANQAMYERARQLVEPGTSELDLYCELQRVATQTLGEPLTYFGQDFQSASRGGPPRSREAQAGELYILDLGVGYRGYFSDNARTLAVGAGPSDSQLAAWQHLTQVFRFVESTVRPGTSCVELFRQVDDMLAAARPWVFNHHLGHGVGLSPHEGPHLNPNWDDTFSEGDFFTVEPGLYHPDLNAGIRLEQNYLVTAQGVELLTPWPLELC